MLPIKQHKIVRSLLAYLYPKYFLYYLIDTFMIIFNPYNSILNIKHHDLPLIIHESFTSLNFQVCKKKLKDLRIAIKTWSVPNIWKAVQTHDGFFIHYLDYNNWLNKLFDPLPWLQQLIEQAFWSITLIAVTKFDKNSQ